MMGKRRKRLRLNSNGGVYASGCAFTEEKWAEIAFEYYNILDKDGKCSVHHLARRCSISWDSANKAILSATEMGCLPVIRPRGHGMRGVGSLYGFMMEHHCFIYKLYLKNPSRQVYSYIRKFKKAYGVQLSENFIARWFKNIGPFREAMRLTCTLPPPVKESPQTLFLLDQFLDFMTYANHRRLVFADEKTITEKDIFNRDDHRDPFMGVVPQLRCSKANSKFRYNVFAAVSLKKHAPFCTRVVIDENGDALMFQAFVSECLREGILEPYDIFVVDSCTIHFQGEEENDHLQELLWENWRIAYVPLPPYHPELNPTELVFRSLLSKLRSLRCIFDISEFDFLPVIRNELEAMTYSYRRAKSFFRECGYYK